MIVDLRDFDFLLSWLDLEGLLDCERFDGHTRADIDAVLQLAESIGTHELAPHLRSADLDEPRMTEVGAVIVHPAVARAVRTMGDAGLFGTVFDAEHGGAQLPHLVHVAVMGILMSANLATASFMLLTVGNARLLTSYASANQISVFAEPQIAGKALGTMCLSEPHAGSSLGDILTRAAADPIPGDALGQRYRITGNKMWISAGDHDVTEDVTHLVLAKVVDGDGNVGPGTQGISLFIVPKTLPGGELNDIAVAGLNHKMGYRGLPNCALNFGEGRHRPEDRAGAIGWLVGDIGQGLPQMFQMMNEARVSVGLAGAMLAVRGYQMSLDYARDRRQGRAGGPPSAPQVPIIEHADVRRMLLAQKAISQGALSLVLYSALLLDREKTASSAPERASAAALLALLTPVAKTWPSEWAQISLHHALQIHGGAGYTRDFEIEQLYRDNRLNPIHEGTTGIQGIDLVGRKLRRDRGAAFKGLAREIRATLDRTPPASALQVAAGEVVVALNAFEAALIVLLAESDETKACAHGTPVLLALGHLVVGWLWLDQALLAEVRTGDAADEATQRFLRGRIRACRYFAETELPAVSTWLSPVLAESDLVMTMPTDEF